jgi:hypothetical protein
LLSEAFHLGFPPYADASRKMTGYIHCNYLPHQRPEHDIVRNENEVEISLLIAWVIWRGSGDAMGKEEEWCKGIRNAVLVLREQAALVKERPDIGAEELPVDIEDDRDKEDLECGR